MLKTIKRIILGSLSILGISFLIWTVVLLNPNLSYANETKIDQITIYHNQELGEGAETVIKNAIDLIKASEIYDEQLNIQLCMNDDELYPNLLNRLVGHPLAFAVLNKTIVKNCEVKFDENLAEASWAVNNFELRKFDLTYLLAHEFTHNLQFNAKTGYTMKTTFGKINWKLEGYADYTARGYQQDGKLKSKIEKYLAEEKLEHNGLPVFELEDGTKQILSYFKYSLVIQYLLEEKGLSFDQVCELDRSFDDLYAEMIEWYQQ